MIIHKATLKDLIEASQNLCEHDLKEFHCHTAGRDPKDVLPAHLDETTMVVKVGALVLAVGGSKGCLWFVTTNVVNSLNTKERMAFLKILKDHLRDVKDHSPFDTQLTNFVSVDNKPHIRLLNALGASWSNVITMSPAGFAFKQFWL